MFGVLGAAMRQIRINPGMQTLDWCIIIGMIVFLIAVLLYCNRYMRNAADFLAASRCAGRYVLSIASGVAGFAVISSVATFEMFYKAGFSSMWWSFLSSPLNLVLSLVGWVSYRMRETRCFTLAQFYEVRYSRKFRVAAGILTWISGVWNYGIFPAVSVRFFMFFCRFPEYFKFLGVNWNTYGVLLFVAIGLGVFFAVCGGQIAIMVTDFLQGIFCNVALADQFLSIILTSSVFKDIYRDHGYESRLLSRTCEDGATVTSVLVPWNTCGLVQSTVLGVATLTYLPYCFFNLLSPVTSIVVAVGGWGIIRHSSTKVAQNAAK